MYLPLKSSLISFGKILYTGLRTIVQGARSIIALGRGTPNPSPEISETFTLQLPEREKRSSSDPSSLKSILRDLYNEAVYLQNYREYVEALSQCNDKSLQINYLETHIFGVKDQMLINENQYPNVLRIQACMLHYYEKELDMLLTHLMRELVVLDDPTPNAFNEDTVKDYIHYYLSKHQQEISTNDNKTESDFINAFESIRVSDVPRTAPNDVQERILKRNSQVVAMKKTIRDNLAQLSPKPKELINDILKRLKTPSSGSIRELNGYQAQLSTNMSPLTRQLKNIADSYLRKIKDLSCDHPTVNFENLFKLFKQVDSITSNKAALLTYNSYWFLQNRYEHLKKLDQEITSTIDAARSIKLLSETHSDIEVYQAHSPQLSSNSSIHDTDNTLSSLNYGSNFEASKRCALPAIFTQKRKSKKTGSVSTTESSSDECKVSSLKLNHRSLETLQTIFDKKNYHNVLNESDIELLVINLGGKFDRSSGSSKRTLTLSSVRTHSFHAPHGSSHSENLDGNVIKGIREWLVEAEYTPKHFTDAGISRPRARR